MKYFIPAGTSMTVFYHNEGRKSEVIAIGVPYKSEKDVTYTDADLMTPSSITSRRFRLPKSPKYHYESVEFAVWDVQEIPE